jgi:hypothetical protein
VAPLGSPARLVPSRPPSTVSAAAPEPPAETPSERPLEPRVLRAPEATAAFAPPQSLLPAAPVTRPFAVDAARPARSAQSELALERAGAETDTDVHVSIGRIEVTALGAPPPARRRVNPAQKPLSLADYLSARQTRRR